jgi:hypothetical protein
MGVKDSVSGPEPAPMTAGEYCRAIEAHLCRENGGHLVRIVGPAFQTVSGWYARGIPFAIVRQGIDRTVARDRARPATGSARRPVRVEFCEADVLDAFDAWRRAVGVGMAGERESAPMPGGAAADAGVQGSRGRTPSLVAHVDRAMQRLTQALLDLGRFTPGEAAAARTAMEQALAALDALRADARAARGAARTAVHESLATADEALATALIAALPPPAAADLARAARAELAPFAGRMTAADLAAAEAAALRRLARERFGAPELAPARS